MEAKQVTGMLQQFLQAFGFNQMAEDVVKETDPQRIRLYARIVVKNAPDVSRKAIFNRFALLNLV